MKTWIVLVIVSCLCIAGSVQAQTIQGCGGVPGTVTINPTAYCFESSDWGDSNFGTPVVSGAKILVYTQTGTPQGPTLVATVDIGHPAAQAGKTADNYYVVKGPFARPSGAPADGVTTLVAVIEETLAAGGVTRSAPGSPFGYSKSPGTSTVKPPIMSRISPSTITHEPCIWENGSGCWSGTRHRSTEPAPSISSSTRLETANWGGRWDPLLARGSTM